MNTKSFCVTSIEGLIKELDTVIANNFQPTVAMIFSSPSVSYQQLPALFTSYNIALIGCTTMGEIYDDEIFKDSISVLLMDMKKENFEVVEVDCLDQDIYAEAQAIGKKATETFENPGLLLVTGGIDIDGNQLVTSLKEGVSKNIPLYGGLAGDGARFETTYCFGQNTCTSKGIIAMVINNDKIKLNGLSYSGWEELGATHEITKAIGNVVYEINGKPASEEFEKYFGKLRYNLSADDEFEVLAGQFPLKILKQEGVSVLRSVMVSDEKEKSLTLAGGVQTGESFKFCTTPSFDVVDNTIQHFEELKSKTGKVDAIIMFSCGARLSVFGPMLEKEIEDIFEYWKQPMVGFFSYGEIGSTKLGNKNCEFHNVTCSLVTLTEA